VTDDLDASPSSAPAASPVATADARPVDDRTVARSPKKGINRTIVEWVVLVVAAVVIAVVIKSFLFQAFYIPSASMDPTLQEGDRILVNKLSYDLHDVHRGDIIVFAAGPNKEWNDAGIDDLVKRVIALPGETITQCGQSRICIDGHELKETYLPKDVSPSLPWFTTPPPGCEPDSPEGGCTVPPGHYFVMGDNRDDSLDARRHGPIKGSSIVGRVFVRIWPLDRLGFL
jgi:signal peptidase I